MEDTAVLTGKVTRTAKSEVNTQVEALAPVEVNKELQGNDDSPTSPLVMPRSVSESKLINRARPSGEKVAERAWVPWPVLRSHTAPR